MRGKSKFSILALVTALLLSAPLAAAAAPIDSTSGYDVSWPQCSQSLPIDGAFKIIGVNNGLAFSDNPCFQEQLIWAGEEPQLYFNTGNPGPALSSFWPLGQKTPKICSDSAPDSHACAFNYGYNFAEYSFEAATLAYQSIGLAITPKDSFIWLDVETMNSWRINTAKNVSALKGAVYYLKQVAKVAKLGFYSNDYQWGVITGGTDAFAGYPSWLATASTRELSIEACQKQTGFTGGRLRLTQYIDPDLGLDVNINCLNVPLLTSTFSKVRPSAVDSGGYFTLKAKLLSESGKPIKSAKVVVIFRGDRFVSYTNKYGVAKFSLRASRATGDKPITVRYKGSSYYEATSYVGVITVQ